ncbi:phosphodiester glycosidase family protein [Mobilicoccus massiliensis]|uniref:phosphodiester glycosidase family protein n=1 Tax=Mobilicoccus massiliensis TaxID=1522310 RepID=UPI00058BC2A7|nr:phosphodiester glycosidase family protein [Mobilicoccus massiliensis]
MIASRRRAFAAVPAALAAVLAVSAVVPAGAATSRPDPGDPREGYARDELPLGRADLAEMRATTTLQPGATLTKITRGVADGSSRWVVELSIPSTTSSPDPDAPARAVQDAESAGAFVAKLSGAGFAAQATDVRQLGAADVPDGVIGRRVRLVETFVDQAAADGAVARLKAAGFTARSWYSGWDGGTPASGPWTMSVLTIDPKRFDGRLVGTYGPDLEKRETTSQLAARLGATAAANAGFFVMDPKAGVEGDPAGIAAYDGRVVSEAVGDRPAVLLDARARQTRILRPGWAGTFRTGGRTHVLDGTNRVPGLIRNCGGTGDTPTDLPRHDVTCTDADELVLFTPAFGATTPAGPGREVVLDRRGRVVTTPTERGIALTAGQRSIQATGDAAGALASLRVGDRVPVTATMTRGSGRPMHLRKDQSVINGGPLLLRAGRTHITQKRDGMNQAVTGNPSFDYGWVLQRNPRTFIGTDRRGRTMIVAADGRQTGHLGLLIPETAAVAKALGMREAMNLDGGGSTTLVASGALATSPSDATGERPVGDAIAILPRR